MTRRALTAVEEVGEAEAGGEIRMSHGGAFEYKGYRIEALRGFRSAAIHPPYGGLPLERLATAFGENREVTLFADAQKIIKRVQESSGDTILISLPSSAIGQTVQRHF